MKTILLRYQPYYIKGDLILAKLKHNLSIAQARMKRMVDKKLTEVSFIEEESVFVKLQPYRQHSLALREKIISFG